MSWFKDLPEMKSRPLTIPSFSEYGVINGTENSVFSKSAYVEEHTDGHLDKSNCKEGLTSMFTMELTKKRKIFTPLPKVPYTVLASYTLLQDHMKKGLGIELRRGDITFFHGKKELHGSDMLKMLLQEVCWFSSNIQRFNSEIIKKVNFQLMLLDHY